MKKLALLLALLLFVSGLPVTARGSDDFAVTQAWDNAILAGGIFDMWAWVGDAPENYTFRWQADTSMGKGHWMDLEDNANPYGYRGTKTAHMEFVTLMEGSFTVGSGWEDIPFRCLVTNQKTGVSRSTVNMFMRIYSQEDMTAYLKRQGFGLYEPTASPLKLTTKNYIDYTGIASAGKAIEFVGGCWRPGSDHLLRASGATEDVQIWVSENGSTVKQTDMATYSPYTIGQDTLTVQFKLHYTLGIHDMGFYETKTLRISTTEPAAVAYGTLKGDRSLLRERYTQAQKLANIPGGTRLKVSEISAGWFQVVYGNLVGYVSADSLTLDANVPIIDHVEVTVSEPRAGQNPATACGLAPDTCHVSYMEWRDLTEDRFITPSETFQKGHDYQLVVWAEADDGYEFKLEGRNVKTTAVLNGNLPAFTYQAYEQIIGQVIEIRYDFKNIKEEVHTCLPLAVRGVAPTCTDEGIRDHYACSCGAVYADPQGAQPRDPGWTVLPATGHRAGAFTGNGTHHYRKCTVCLAVIPATNAPHSGGTATCTQKATCAVCATPYGQLAGHSFGQVAALGLQGHGAVCTVCGLTQDLQPHTPGPAATEVSAQSCTVCGYVLEPAKNHVHAMKQIPGKAATCTQAGNLDHYLCEGCGVLYRDPEGKTPVGNHSILILAPTGHMASDTWESSDRHHWRTCTTCGQVLEETKMLHDGDSACHTCGYTLVTGQTKTPNAPAETVSPGKPHRPDTAGKTDAREEGTPWLLLCLVAVGGFALSLTVTLFVLKRKKK